MPKLLQINITANWGSTGKIVETIGVSAMAHGRESYIAYGRWSNPSQSHLIRIGGRCLSRYMTKYIRVFFNATMMIFIRKESIVMNTNLIVVE